MTTPASRTRLSPAARRAQLLELGARLFATRSVDEISIDVLAEEAGVSRGLLYHYFGSKQDFRLAVIRHAVEDLVEQTAPPADGEPLERMLASLGVYVDYVLANLTLYRSLVRAAAGGTDEIRALYDEGRFALTDRIFREDAEGEIVKDTPQSRLVVRGWSAMAEEMVLTWADDPSVMTRDELLSVLALYAPAESLSQADKRILPPCRSLSVSGNPPHRLPARDAGIIPDRCGSIRCSRCTALRSVVRRPTSSYRPHSLLKFGYRRMPDWLSIHEPVLINTVGHAAGAVIFGILLYFLVAGRQRAWLPSIAAALAMLWNVGSLVTLAAGPKEGSLADIAAAASFSVLSLLPAVLAPHLARPPRQKDFGAGLRLSAQLPSLCTWRTSSPALPASTTRRCCS